MLLLAITLTACCRGLRIQLYLLLLLLGLLRLQGLCTELHSDGAGLKHCQAVVRKAVVNLAMHQRGGAHRMVCRAQRERRRHSGSRVLTACGGCFC